jgi:hypothetical protein
MPRARDWLQELGQSLGFEVHYSSHKIWVNRTVLGGRFSKCFTDYGGDENSFRKYVADWLKTWAPTFGAFDPPAREKRNPPPAFSMGFKESE